MESAKEMLVERLRAIASEVSVEDRKECESTLEITRQTITSYLNGDVSNVDLGLKIYELFAGRIKERVERIKAIA